MCPDCQHLQRLNTDLVERLAAAAYVLSRAAERNGLVDEVARLREELRQSAKDAEASA